MGVRLDSKTGTMEFFHGGESLGVAFRNVTFPVRPAVSFDGGTQGEVELLPFPAHTSPFEPEEDEETEDR